MAEGAQDATQTPTMELEPQQKGLGTQVYNFFLKQFTVAHKTVPMFGCLG